MGNARVPQEPNHAESVVDQLIVDRGLTQLDRTVEEFSDQQVLTLGRELEEAEGLRARYARVADDAQGVVLLLHETAHGIERLLVLEAAVEELAADLVPAVRPQVRLGVELAEQVARRRSLDA